MRPFSKDRGVSKNSHLRMSRELWHKKHANARIIAYHKTLQQGLPTLITTDKVGDWRMTQSPSNSVICLEFGALLCTSMCVWIVSETLRFPYGKTHGGQRSRCYALPWLGKLCQVMSPGATSHFAVHHIQKELHAPLMSISECYVKLGDTGNEKSSYAHDSSMCLNCCKFTTMTKTSAVIQTCSLHGDEMSWKQQVLVWQPDQSNSLSLMHVKSNIKQTLNAQKDLLQRYSTLFEISLWQKER